jgi:hypothetical protein
LDVIDEISFSALESITIKDYLTQNIHSKFSDQSIWVKKTNYSGAALSLIRNYNRSIIEALINTNSIKKVINTMGKNRIVNYFNISPGEKKLQQSGFGGFIREIINICDERDIIFVYQSLSPSGWAVNNGSTNYNELKDWLRVNLNLGSLKK